MTKGIQTKARIIEVASDLLQRNGFHAMGINQITAKGNLPKGSIYFHFPGGKEEIALAAIEQGGAVVEKILVTALEQSVSPIEYLETVVAAFAHLLDESAFQKGCPVSSIALEMVPESPEITKAVRQVFDNWHEETLRALAQLNCTHPDLRSLTSLLLSSVEGALILCRAQQSTAPLENICASLRPLFKN
ncbi:TetR family transcriptional regulator [Sneathiella sp. P13V-1]|uniref:TetR/AcrR family transcriptional regulator n=1 Tax=Sneathiella sp. P13V-1 TaxID=2697366 RepID=UPI00187B30D7|nr:TetR/AcrR family transcriptional regulator [Sneathiella sp. P13V-1]MBE7636321.1 TetR family transcriptional regulator [Sneathiella sp. P13V-1]